MSDLVAGSPARNAVAVTPHDSNAIADGARAFFIGTGGNVTLRPLDGSADVVFKNLASGSYLLCRSLYVRATGTTATDILALY